VRIAYVNLDTGVPLWGFRKGCSAHVQETLRALIAQGGEPEIFCTTMDGVPPADLGHLTVRCLPRITAGHWRGEREKLQHEMNDLLLRLLHSAPQFDFVYERQSLWSYAAMEFAAETGVPGLLEVNAPLIEEQDRYRELVHRDLAVRATARACASASYVLPVSENLRPYLHNFDVPNERIVVVPNAVDVQRFFPSKPDTHAPAPREFSIGFLGSLKPWHGVDTLITALKQVSRDHPHTRLTIIGDGPERGRLATMAAERGLEDVVEFTGSLPHQAIPARLRALDCAVAPYPQTDNFYFSPLKLFEYMATGLPVVASDIGQIAECITHEKNGLLCRPGDPESLARQISRLIGDPELAEQISGNARRHAVEKFSWERNVCEILDLVRRTRQHGLSGSVPH